MSRPDHHGQFFASPSSITEDSVTLRGPDAVHLKVRRAKPGDLLRVGDGAGRLVEAVLEAVDTTSAVATVLSSEYVERPSPRLTVYQGLAKSGKVDWVVEKLVELGVDEVVIFAAGRSVPVWDSSKGRAMLARWERIAYAASKQSRRAWLPAVTGPLDPESLLRRLRAEPAALVADPDAPASLGAALADLGAGAGVGVVIGPEGGLSRPEVGQLVDAGGTPVHLGSQILRTETAGLAVAAVVMHHLGRFG